LHKLEKDKNGFYICNECDENEKDLYEYKKDSQNAQSDCINICVYDDNKYENGSKNIVYSVRENEKGDSEYYNYRYKITDKNENEKIIKCSNDLVNFLNNSNRITLKKYGHSFFDFIKEGDKMYKVVEENGEYSVKELNELDKIFISLFEKGDEKNTLELKEDLKFNDYYVNYEGYYGLIDGDKFYRFKSDVELFEAKECKDKNEQELIKFVKGVEPYDNYMCIEINSRNDEEKIVNLEGKICKMTNNDKGTSTIVECNENERKLYEFYNVINFTIVDNKMDKGFKNKEGGTEGEEILAGFVNGKPCKRIIDDKGNYRIVECNEKNLEDLTEAIIKSANYKYKDKDTMLLKTFIKYQDSEEIANLEYYKITKDGDKNNIKVCSKDEIKFLENFENSFVIDGIECFYLENKDKKTSKSKKEFYYKKYINKDTDEEKVKFLPVAQIKELDRKIKNIFGVSKNKQNGVKYNSFLITSDGKKMYSSEFRKDVIIKDGVAFDKFISGKKIDDVKINEKGEKNRKTTEEKITEEVDNILNNINEKNIYYRDKDGYIRNFKANEIEDLKKQLKKDITLQNRLAEKFENRDYHNVRENGIDIDVFELDGKLYKSRDDEKQFFEEITDEKIKEMCLNNISQYNPDFVKRIKWNGYKKIKISNLNTKHKRKNKITNNDFFMTNAFVLKNKFNNKFPNIKLTNTKQKDNIENNKENKLILPNIYENKYLKNTKSKLSTLGFKENNNNKEIGFTKNEDYSIKKVNKGNGRKLYTTYGNGFYKPKHLNNRKSNLYGKSFYKKGFQK